jgi:signal transduction protein with GAF and PtsI domain
MKKIGEGLSCSSNSEVVGEVVYVQSVEDVIELFDNAGGKICIVDDSGTTTLGPILSELAGVICTAGAAGSHLAIVSREFGIPCIMGINIMSEDLSSLNGRECKIITEGTDKGILLLVE